jgi:hypothetical protein
MLSWFLLDIGLFFSSTSNTLLYIHLNWPCLTWLLGAQSLSPGSSALIVSTRSRPSSSAPVVWTLFAWVLCTSLRSSSWSSAVRWPYIPDSESSESLTSKMFERFWNWTGQNISFLGENPPNPDQWTLDFKLLLSRKQSFFPLVLSLTLGKSPPCEEGYSGSDMLHVSTPVIRIPISISFAFGIRNGNADPGGKMLIITVPNLLILIQRPTVSPLFS